MTSPKNLEISIIIPAYNKAGVLEGTLQALSQQTIEPESYEVIVVDDGSEDSTSELASEYSSQYQLHLVKQNNLGAAAARNRGVARARGEILLFLDADMHAAPDLLGEHLHCQRTNNSTLFVGRIVPEPNSYQSRIQKLVVDRGFDLGSEARAIGFDQAFTTNLSMRKASFHQLGGFNEQLRRWHDVEFAYRARNSGHQIFYCPVALAYHNHPSALNQFFNTTIDQHKAAVKLLNLHSELRDSISYLIDKQPIDWNGDSAEVVFRKMGRQLLAEPRVLRMTEMALRLSERLFPSAKILDFLYWKIIGSYQLYGIREGIREYGW